MGFIRWLMRGLTLILLTLLCGAFLFVGAVLGLTGFMTTNSASMYGGIVLLIIGSIMGLYIVYKYNLMSEWGESKREPYYNQRIPKTIDMVVRKERPYYTGPGILTEMAQKEISGFKRKKK